MTTNFELGKTYSRRDGLTVTVTKVDITVISKQGIVEGSDSIWRWDDSGRVYDSGDSPEDLMLPKAKRLHQRGPLKIKD